MSGPNEGRPRLIGADELLRQIAQATSANDRRIDAFMRSNEILPDVAHGRGFRNGNGAMLRWLATVILGVLMLAILVYQAWLTTLQNRRLAVENDLLRDRSALLQLQNTRLTELNSALQQQTSSIKALTDRVAAQEAVLRQQQEALAAQAKQIQGNAALLRAHRYQLPELSRLLKRHLTNAAIIALSESKPCADGAPATPDAPTCPVATIRTRQEALDMYLAVHQASRGAGSPNLSNTWLRGLSLRDADLGPAKLWGADVANTDIRGANFGASQGLKRPDHWCFDETTVFPGGFAPGRSDPSACQQTHSVSPTIPRL